MYLLWELYEYTKYLITCLQYHKKLIFSRSFQKLNKSILGQQQREATDAGACQNNPRKRIGSQESAQWSWALTTIVVRKCRNKVVGRPREGN